MDHCVRAGATALLLPRYLDQRVEWVVGPVHPDVAELPFPEFVSSRGDERRRRERLPDRAAPMRGV